MKRLFTFLICCLTFSGLMAQEVTVSSTEEYTNTLQGAYWTRVLGQDASGYYLLREFGPISNRTVLLEKYSPAMKLMYATNIESTTGVMGDSKLHRFTEMNKGKVLVFLEGWNKSKGQNSLLVKEVNEDGSFAEGMRLLETEPATGQMKSANYSIGFSPDGSKLLVLTQKPFEKGGMETLRLQVFDTGNYQSLWKQDLTLTNTSERSPSNNILVNNEGIAYIFKDIKISGKERLYQLITTGKDFSNTAPIELQAYTPGYHKMMVDQSGKMVICGMLSPLGKSDSEWQATWYLQADAQGNILQNKTEQLGSALLKMLVSAKNADKEGYVLQNFVLKDILIKPTGGLMLLAEEQRQNRSPIDNLTPPTYLYEMTYGNILIVSFDVNGSRTGSSVIEKRQTEKTLDPRIHYGSFAYQLQNEKLYVVWNYMDLRSDPPLNKFRYWIDRNGNKINIDNLFGREALYPTLLTVVNADGSFQYADRTFSSYPLETIQKPNAFPMAVDPSMYFTTPKGMIILSRMPGFESKRYKFNTIGY